VRLEITLAGDVTVGNGDGRDRHVVTGPSRVVLAALALAPATGVPRDRLAGIVWPEAMPRTWASALRTHVSRVRSVVSTVVGAGETVVSGDAGYHLVLPDGVTLSVDLHRADQALDAAREALGRDPAGALRLATTAAELVRPPFLPGHVGGWADDIRAHLDDVLVGALELASQAATAGGDGVRAVAAAEDAVQRAPLRESAHRALMAALGGAGNRAEALRVYQRLRRVLADELGVDPSPETDAAYLDLLGPAPPPRPPRGPGTDDPGGSPGPDRGLAAAAPFVGREAELATLAAAWEQAAGGARHVVVVTGEAGIGKTRLTVEAAWRVRRDGGLVLFGRCDQEAIVPYQPLVEALDGLVAATPPEELPFLGDEAMAELGAVLPSLDRPGRPAGPDRARLFGAVTDLVAAVAKERPLLLVLDDLQWADDDTLLLVRHLLRRAGDAPVLVVAISRDHDLEPGHALADIVHSLDRDGWVRRLPLRGLDAAEVRELLAHLQGPGDHGGAARRLAAETAGNPFLVTELARAGGGAGAIGERDIPQSVQDLVSTRLARLDPPSVELLRAGAVAGARFDLDLAGQAAGLAHAALLDAADAALASGLVVEESADRYRFPHDIVRRTLVVHLSGARRRSLHRRTADAIEHLRSHDLEAQAAVLAHHSSAGADPAGDDRAVHWARRASAHAARRSAPAEAVRLCRQALAHLLPDRGGVEAEVTTDLGIALLAAGDESGARTLIEGARLARRHDRPDVLGRAALALADAADDRPDLQSAARELVTAAAAAATTGPTGPSDPSDSSVLSDDDGATAAVRHARLLVRQLRLTGSAGGPPPQGALEALHHRIEALTDPRAVDERQRLADELAVLAAAADDPTYRVLAAHEQAMAAATVGDDAGVQSALAQVATVVAAHDDAFGTALLAERTVAQLTTDGHFDQAREALVTAVAATESAGGSAGGADDMAARHRTVIDWLTGGGEPLGDPHRPLPDGPDHLHALGIAALAACDAADPAAVTEVRALLAPYADLVCGMGYRTFVGAATFHLGRLAAVAGDWAEAERHLLAALRLHSAWRARPWVALTQGALAGVLEARGRPSDREWIAGLRAEAAWVTGNLGLRTL
jgi:DNA-binding SARP family transcriptional activator